MAAWWGPEGRAAMPMDAGGLRRGRLRTPKYSIWARRLPPSTFLGSRCCPEGPGGRNVEDGTSASTIDSRGSWRRRQDIDPRESTVPAKCHSRNCSLGQAKPGRCRNYVLGTCRAPTPYLGGRVSVLAGQGPAAALALHHRGRGVGARTRTLQTATSTAAPDKRGAGIARWFRTRGPRSRGRGRHP